MIPVFWSPATYMPMRIYFLRLSLLDMLLWMSFLKPHNQCGFLSSAAFVAVLSKCMILLENSNSAVRFWLDPASYSVRSQGLYFLDVGSVATHSMKESFIMSNTLMSVCISVWWSLILRLTGGNWSPPYNCYLLNFSQNIAVSVAVLCDGH